VWNCYDIYLRPSFLIQLNCHECRRAFLVDAGIASLPEEVGASSSTNQRLARLVALQSPRTYREDNSQVECVTLQTTAKVLTINRRINDSASDTFRFDFDNRELSTEE